VIARGYFLSEDFGILIRPRFYSFPDMFYIPRASRTFKRRLK
jgi:hypothetical protein